jgi:hypothetical protein
MADGKARPYASKSLNEAKRRPTDAQVFSALAQLSAARADVSTHTPATSVVPPGHSTLKALESRPSRRSALRLETLWLEPTWNGDDPEAPVNLAAGPV